jgi:hypothetical protein
MQGEELSSAAMEPCVTAWPRSPFPMSRCEQSPPIIRMDWTARFPPRLAMGRRGSNPVMWHVTGSTAAQSLTGLSLVRPPSELETEFELLKSLVLLCEFDAQCAGDLERVFAARFVVASEPVFDGAR